MNQFATPEELEKHHVRDVYDKIAPHFAGYSHKAWPRVEEFLLSLPAGSLIADVGESLLSYGLRNEESDFSSCNTDHLELSVIPVLLVMFMDRPFQTKDWKFIFISSKTNIFELLNQTFQANKLKSIKFQYMRLFFFSER